MTGTLDTDYLVVGAGAMGMAFTDALIDHDPKARVAVVDRRHAPGGHWVAAYPFVRLHQSSDFYGMASTRLGGGQVQQRGPEAGLQERASQPEILSYLETNYGGEILLVPRATGFDALVWALPAAALVCALAALTATFLRWRREAAADADPTEEDRALVAASLEEEPSVEDDEP